MRIIAGDFRRRVIAAPEGLGTRPIPDRVKEALFSMLGLRVQDAQVVDLFAGSGAIGLEALSRGARSCMFVEHGRDAAETLQANIDLLGCNDRARVVQGDALSSSVVARAPRPLDLVFMDPPYPIVRDALSWPTVKEQAEEFVQLLGETGFVILRTPWPFVLDGGGDEEEGDAPVEAVKKYRSKAKRDRFRFDADRPSKASARTPVVPHKPGRGKKGQATNRVEHLHRMSLNDAVLDSETLTGMRDEMNADLGGRGAGTAGDAVELVQGEGGVWREPTAAERGVRAERAEEVEMELPPGFADAMASQNAKKELADLTLRGARGPETHVYGTTAIHFYMKARGASTGAAEGVAGDGDQASAGT